jgi:hypothetical protein
MAGAVTIPSPTSSPSRDLLVPSFIHFGRYSLRSRNLAPGVWTRRLLSDHSFISFDFRCYSSFCAIYAHQ